MCKTGRDLRKAYYDAALVVKWTDPQRKEKIASDRARPEYQKALYAWAEHWRECEECRQEE
jgi:hypothetical protein